MIINGKLNHRHLTINQKINCLTVSLSEPESDRVFSFDLEGRLWTAMSSGISYRRGLNGKIVAKWIQPDGTRTRRWLNSEEAENLLSTARETTNIIFDAIQHQQATLDQAVPNSALQTATRIAGFDHARYRQDIDRYQQVYQPVGILPPDQYMALVLQATEGCSFNTCTFCDFYRGRRFHIKTVDEMAEHISAVQAYLGEGLSLRRTIFLGDANALVAPMTRLVQWMELIHARLPVDAIGGLYAFLDGFSGERKTTKDYDLLAKGGFKRIYIGMESGSQALLRFLKKPGSPQDVLKAVQAIKSGGISVGIIILLGAGGQQYAHQHVQDTIQLVNEMKLDADDLIYFSELVESEGMQYSQDAFQASLIPLSPQERIRQAEQIEQGFKFNTVDGTPHISRYDIREFVF